MTDRTCSVDGCERPMLAKDLCKAHYARMKRNGEPGSALIAPPVNLKRVPRVGCLVEGCERPHRSLGYCYMHYQRFFYHGDPLAVGSSRFMPGTDHPNWKGDAVSYLGAHHRVVRLRGLASDHRCVECGEPAAQWAYDHSDPEERVGSHGRCSGLRYSVDPDHYQPMCASCHVRLDVTERRASRKDLGGIAQWQQDSERREGTPR